MSIKYNCALIQVDEIWLKGRNRPHYYKKLKEHINNLVYEYYQYKKIKASFKITNEQQRFSFTTDVEISEDLINRLSLIPGVNSISPAIKVDSKLEDLTNAALALFERFLDEKFTFKVQCKRVDKFFSPDSMEMNRILAGAILEKFNNVMVDVKSPQKTLVIKIFNDYSFLSLEKIAATKGLPIGSGGHVVTMLSGGFDSPVASYLMSKRGCRQTFLFFHAHPFVGDEVKEKIIELTKVLAKYQDGCELWIVPFGEIQKQIAKTCKQEYRTIFFRKFMFDTATMIAKKIKAKAILTGDALGQVSSQTIDNIAMINKEQRLPVFRPLIGFNKQETIALSKHISTHDISIIPHDDACSLFAPKHPIISPNWFYWDDYMRDNKFTEFIEEAMNTSEILKFNTLGNTHTKTSK